MVTVEVLYSSTGYTSEIRLFQPAPEQSIGLNRNLGKVVTRGPFADGDELVFGIYVQNTNRTFRMGPGTRNPDGIVHAAVTPSGAGSYVVGFEDLFGGGDQDFDDVRFRVTGAVGLQTFTTESVPTLSEWMLAALALALLLSGAYFVRQA